MDKLKISTRLTVLIVGMSLLLMAAGGMGLFSLSQSNAALRSVYEHRTVPTGHLGEVESLLISNRLAIAVAMVTPTPAVIADSTSKVEANMTAIGKTWDAYMATRLTDEEVKLAEAFAEHRKVFVNEGLKPALAALKANDVEEAKRLTVSKIRPLYEPVKKDLDALVRFELSEAKSEFTQATERYDTLRVATVVGIFMAVLTAVLFGFFLTRSVTRQLGAEPFQAAAVAKRVAAGDLSAVISLQPGDTSSLMAQLKGMQASLAQVVSKVRQNSDSVASASAQIAQGNNDLSSRTEEQASALQQTAASMEQISVAVKQNADNAKHANERALGASAVAARGGDVVGQVVSTMKGINESSKKIADIISVIDSIAFQTNILALNAAVEAARAGEQGRGFAVVASEVRSLAGRSAEAAKEIKTLIDASVNRVELGTQLADQAGTTMAEVVTAIKHVTDIMSELSAASAEQSEGVAQVGEAVSQMDRNTQQNAALVEESAAASESLKVQAEKLVDAVALFKLAAGDESLVAANDASVMTPSTEERRGPQGVAHVSRLPIGAVSGAKLAAKNAAKLGTAQAVPASLETSASPASPAPSTASRTGTDDWTTF